MKLSLEAVIRISGLLWIPSAYLSTPSVVFISNMAADEKILQLVDVIIVCLVIASFKREQFHALSITYQIQL